jgi:hypothetical protein
MSNGLDYYNINYDRGSRNKKIKFIIILFLLIASSIVTIFFISRYKVLVEKPDKEKVIKNILSYQNEVGFDDIKRMYEAVVTLKRLNTVDRIKNDTINYIKSHERSDGGYGFKSYNSSTDEVIKDDKSNLVDTYFAIQILHDLNSISELDVDSVSSFLSNEKDINNSVYTCAYFFINRSIDENTKNKIIQYNLDLYQGDHFKKEPDLLLRGTDIASTLSSMYVLSILGGMGRVDEGKVTNFMRQSLDKPGIDVSDTYLIIDYLKNLDKYTRTDKNKVNSKNLCEVKDGIFCIYSCAGTSLSDRECYDCSSSTQFFCVGITGFN